MIPYCGEGMAELALTFWEQKPDFKELNDLGKIAVQVGTFMEEQLVRMGGTPKPLEGNSDMIMDLQCHKSKAALFEPLIVETMKKKFPQLQYVKIPIDKKNWTFGNGIGIKKENAELAEKVRDAVQKLKEEGTMQKLEQKWMGGHE